MSTAETIAQPWVRAYRWFMGLDPRHLVASILFFYLFLGLTVLGFNRSPLQAITTTLVCLFFEAFLGWLFYRNWRFSIGALTTSFSLSFLLNYSHESWFLLIPPFLAIGSKYLFQLRGRHFFNPAMFGVSTSLLLSQELITAAPAYQWNGIANMAVFVLMLGLLFVLPKVNRHWLVLSFLTMFTLQTALRAYIMRYHLPFTTLFFGTLSSPSFLIFSFFMITDPPTSPPDRRNQIIVGIALALVDLLLHLKQSYYTFFYSALIVGTTRFIWFHFKGWRKEGLWSYPRDRFFISGFWKRPVAFAFVAAFAVLFYREVLVPSQNIHSLPWTFEKVNSEHSGLRAASEGPLIRKLDPRIQHIAKWLVAETEGIAVGDVNQDGLLDLFASQAMKEDSEKAVLYINKGGYQFEKQAIPDLAPVIADPKMNGLITNGIFVDFDNDGDQDLFLTEVFGPCRLLENLGPDKNYFLQDITTQVGLKGYCQSLGANFVDINRDGLLDIFVTNVLEENLPGYSTPTKLNLFSLPPPEFPGDERMFNFMHESWNLANNGGLNQLYLQTSDHKFVLQDPEKWQMTETRWSLVAGSSDFNQDGWPDIYVANDFGPDDLYYNVEGKKMRPVRGTIFGSIGKDTYKGMNVSIADFDHSGYLDIYVSNVHHALQAEGSLFWKFSASKESQFYPEIQEVATQRGALNENRFGWGASATDFDNDGWVDLAVANGMVDDTYDKKFEDCPDYWYVNEKIARSPPEIHRYANRWGDIRGYCIFGRERNRLYLNQGIKARPQYVDIAEKVGLVEMASSRAVVSADFVNQGRRDLLFTHPFKEPSFYRNRFLTEKATSPSWVGFELKGNGVNCNRDAIGTRLDLYVSKANGEHYRVAQEIQSGSGFLGQSDRRLHFGLGYDVTKVEATIKWCGFKAERVRPAMNQYNYFIQP